MSAEELFLLPEEFTQAAAQHLATEPDVEVIGVSDLTLHLRVGGREVTSDLESFYALYRNAPDELPAIWQTLVEVITEHYPDRSEDDPGVLLQRVLPMLKPISLLNEVRTQDLPMLVYRPLAGELIVTYVIDEGQRVAYLNEEHIRRWGVSETTLWARAITNLRKKPWKPEPSIIGQGAGKLLICSTRDGYAATRLVLPELFSEFTAGTPGNTVLGVPNRDFLIAFSDADPRIFMQVRTQVETDARAHEYPLSGQLFTYRNGQLTVYSDNR